MQSYPQFHLAQVTLARIDVLEIAALVVLAGAAAALGMALWAAARAPGGIRGVFLGQSGEETGGGIGSAELRTLMDEADALAEQLAGDLDARAARLESLIAEADARAAPAGPRTEEDEKTSPRRAADRQVTEVKSVSPDPHATMGEHDPMTREIYRLSDTGLPPVEIAKRLSQHTGKVELILALRRG